MRCWREINICDLVAIVKEYRFARIRDVELPWGADLEEVFHLL
jgi:hypothetical protein